MFKKNATCFWNGRLVLKGKNVFVQNQFKTWRASALGDTLCVLSAEDGRMQKHLLFVYLQTCKGWSFFNYKIHKALIVNSGKTLLSLDRLVQGNHHESLPSSPFSPHHLYTFLSQPRRRRKRWVATRCNKSRWGMHTIFSSRPHIYCKRPVCPKCTYFLTYLRVLH